MKGGYIHPPMRARLERHLRLLNPLVRMSPTFFTSTEMESIQNAIRFVNQHRRIEAPAPYNETQGHIRRLERIIDRLPPLGHEETKYS